MAWGRRFKNQQGQSCDGSWNTVQHRRGKWWTCSVPACQEALKGIGKKPWYNSVSEELCGFCQAPWRTVTTSTQFEDAQRIAREAAAAQAPKANASPPAALSKTQARRHRAKKAAAGAAAVVVADAAVAVGTKKTEEPVDCDVDEGGEAVGEPPKPKLLLPQALKELAASLHSPYPLKEGWSVARVIDKQEEADPDEQSRIQEELEGELTDCEALIDLGDGAKRLGVDLAITKVRLAEVTKLLAQPVDKVPTSAVNAAQLLLDKETYIESHLNRRKGAEKGASKARQAFVQLQEAQRQHVLFWQQEMQQTAESELVRAQEWAERENLLLSRHQEVIAEYDRRILAAKPPAGQLDPAPHAAPAACPVPAADWKEKPAFFETVALDFDPQLLPQIAAEDLAKPEIVAALGNLHFLFTHWMQAGAAVPFSFQQLASESKAGSDSKMLVLRMLGEQQHLWFSDGPASDTDLVPRQAVLAVYGVLEAAKIQYEGMEEAKKLAAASYAKLTEQHKKRRVAPQ